MQSQFDFDDVRIVGLLLAFAASFACSLRVESGFDFLLPRTLTVKAAIPKLDRE